MESQWNGLFDNTYGMKMNKSAEINESPAHAISYYLSLIGINFSILKIRYAVNSIKKNLKEHTISFPKHF